MKKYLVGIFLLVSMTSLAQDTTKVEQYCRLVAFNKLLSNKVNIDVDFGQERKFFSDNRLRDEESGRIKKFNTVTDALNYLGSQGWTLVNAYPIMEGSSSVLYFYFKKQFRKEEVN